MKAILNPDGSFRDLVSDETPTAADRTREWVATEPPAITASEVLEESVTVTDTQAIQTWTVRPKTDEEAQTVSTQLSLYSRLSAAERRALRTLANTDSPVGDVALQVEGALFAAVETESRNQQTKALIGAVMALGIVSGIERARELLNDPGFTLQ